MKQRFLDHLSAAATTYRRLVLVITGVLCVTSIACAALFLQFDLSFKGMIGGGVEVVDRYDRIIRDFKVSGLLTLTLEPTADRVAAVGRLNERIDEAVFGVLGEEGAKRIVAMLMEYGRQDVRTLSDKSTMLVAMRVLAALAEPARERMLRSWTSLDERERRFVGGNIASQDRQTRRAVYRKFQRLSREELAALIGVAGGLPDGARDRIVRSVLGQLSVYDKRTLLEELPLEEVQRRELLAAIDKRETEIGTVLGSFKDRVVVFAEDLRSTLVSDTPAGSGQDQLRDVFNGVLYSDEFSFSADQQMFLIMVSPTRNIDDITNAKKFVRLFDEQMTRMKSKYSDLVLRRTGFAAVQMDAQRALFSDFGLMMTATVVGILVIFLVGLKSVDYFFLSMVPLVVSIVIMIGLYSIFGELNLFSMMTPIILFGLGIDYAIHFGSRYGEVRIELGPEASQAEVIRDTFSSIGAGLFIAALTTVFAFLSLLVSVISGFVQSGILAASGVISAFLAMVYVLPILIAWRERRSSKGGQGFRFLRSKRFEPLGRLAASRLGVVLGVLILALALTSMIFLPRIEVEKNGMTLTPEGVESVGLSKDLEEKYDFTDTQAYFIVDGYDALKEFRRELAREEQGHSAYPAINTRRVMDARKAIRTFEKMGWDRKLESLDGYVQQYAEQNNIMGGTNRHIAQMYEFIIRNYIDWQNDRYLVIVPPSGFVWDSDLTDLFIADLGRLERKFGVHSASFVQIWKFLIGHMMSDLVYSSLVAFGLVILILAVTMRSLRGTVICSLAMLITFLSTLSVIGMAGIKFNYVNVMAMPLVIGLGIDYIVHIYYRIVHEEGRDIAGAVSSTGKAVLLTTLTTLMAFGSISFSIHHGLAQMGMITCIGLTIALLCSLLLVPTMVRVAFRGPRE